MNDKHFYLLVQAACAYSKLENDIIKTFGGSISDGPYMDLSLIIRIIKENSRFADAPEYDPLMEILEKENLTMEERIQMLK